MAVNRSDLELIIELVRRKSGIVLDLAKEYLVEARLLPLAKDYKLSSIAELVALLRKPNQGAVEKDIVDAMTTNETSFFRDLHPFHALRDHVLPALIQRRLPERKLALWCAASSTGQEPYTIAMTLREHFPELANWKVSIVASDLSTHVLERAKAGKFSQLEVNRGLPARFLIKYFRRQQLEWEIIPEIRNMIEFRQINLLESWPIMPAIDIVFIRNVLIYFDQDTKRRIFGRIRGTMRSDGYLFLGNAETTLSIDESFERTPFDKSGCFQIKVPAKAVA